MVSHWAVVHCICVLRAAALVFAILERTEETGSDHAFSGLLACGRGWLLHIVKSLWHLSSGIDISGRQRTVLSLSMDLPFTCLTSHFNNCD